MMLVQDWAFVTTHLFSGALSVVTTERMHDLCTAASAPFLFSVQSRLLAWLSYTTGRGAGLIPALGLPSPDLSITSLLLSRTEFGSGAPLSTASPG